MFNRRNFLKTSLMGAGAYAFNPYMNAVGANSKGSSFPKRFVFIRFCNGLHPHAISLPGLKQKEASKEAYEVALDKYELPTYLQGLNEYKEHMTILQGMSATMSENGHGSNQSVMGLFRSKGGKLSALKRTSIDYELAKLFPSPLGHVELSFANNQKGIVPGMSVPAPFQKNFCYADPITAYKNLFQCVLDPNTVSMNNDMYAHIQKKEEAKSQRRQGIEKTVYENHSRSVGVIQDRNKELMKMTKTVSKHMPDKEYVYTEGALANSSSKKQNVMTDILCSTLTSGLTNVATYTLDTLGTTLSGVPGLPSSALGLHDVGHNKTLYGAPANKIRECIRLHYFDQVKTIVDKLKAQPEGNGNMFDNTMIMFFPEGGEKHHSGGIQSPWVVMSGKNCNLDIAGRYIRMPFHGTRGHQTLGNWYTTLLNGHGNNIKHYGDLDGKMSRLKLPQEGAIKRFIKA